MQRKECFVQREIKYRGQEAMEFKSHGPEYVILVTNELNLGSEWKTC